MLECDLATHRVKYSCFATEGDSPFELAAVVVEFHDLCETWAGRWWYLRSQWHPDLCEREALGRQTNQSNCALVMVRLKFHRHIDSAGAQQHTL